MALPIRIALVPSKVQIPPSELTDVASAISKQVDRDFQPLWNIDATVDSFTDLKNVPIDYWPVIVTNNVQGAAGYHQDKNGQPFALVEHDSQWALTASHETLEMLADPFGRRLHAGNVLDQAIKVGVKPGRVRYLVEVCDPCEAGKFAYQVNGVTVSDFYTPAYFDSTAAPGTRYSYTGAVTAPRIVLDEGYISWHDTVTDHWFQLRMFPDDISSKVPHVVDLTNNQVFSRMLAEGMPVRAAVDRVTPNPDYARSLQHSARIMSKNFDVAADAARAANAEHLTTTIREVISRAPRRPTPSGSGPSRKGRGSR
jgi:hypothetical protein